MLGGFNKNFSKQTSCLQEPLTNNIKCIVKFIVKGFTRFLARDLTRVRERKKTIDTVLVLPGHKEQNLKTCINH